MYWIDRNHLPPPFTSGQSAMPQHAVAPRANVLRDAASEKGWLSFSGRPRSKIHYIRHTPQKFTYKSETTLFLLGVVPHVVSQRILEQVVPQPRLTRLVWFHWHMAPVSLGRMATTGDCGRAEKLTCQVGHLKSMSIVICDSRDQTGVSHLLNMLPLVSL